MLAPDALLQNRYQILRPIGKGGMGAVYLAKDERLGNTIALKETFFEDEPLRKAFEREARLLASLRHPALPRVIDHFTEESGQFLVMEFIPGDDLEQMFKERGGPFPLSDVLRWADQLLDALDYLHTQQPPIIHRDIKPQNLKLAARDQIILLDFGLAKGNAAGMSQASATGSIFGYTPTYAPLEQVHGAGTDPRSDLYSLAATLYHLLTGTEPPDALARASVVIGGLADPLRPANELNGQVPKGVAEVLHKAMAIHGDQRPATAEQMRRMLREADQTIATATATNASSQATVIIQPQDSGDVVKQTTPIAAHKSAATIIDSPSNATVTGTTTATVVEEKAQAKDQAKSKETEREPIAPVAPGVAANAPAPKSNRLVLMAGAVVLLLVAGVVIYAMTVGFNSETAGSDANKAGVTNQNTAAQSNKQAQAGAASTDKRKETATSASKPEAAQTPLTDTSPARRGVLPRAEQNQRPTVRERLRRP
ncbi:MAG TPA: serine/threonine-protein kinase [Pyrinomonadaceae bacterium]|nr:serine/threonine-protein kinase [Pyrinomonadaceae bacterium]